ncbi:AraC family transcriptional regulator [Microbulbifer guangxiensis]|uniref:AraC family transcriptional regulator n=1 Tax=Microbulbifer guangxiensis TaxID=2904249 RepID=UPI001F33FD58|nr:AraC family transcriptional regulator [Microbulbifer guangxiensis]
MGTLIKTSALAGYYQLVTDLGGDPAVILRQCHLEPKKVETLEGVISHRSEVCAIERAAQALQCEDFGLRLAETQDASLLGPLAAVALTTTSVGEAMEKIIDYLHWFSPGTAMRLQRCTAPQQSLLSFEVTSNIPRYRHYYEQALAVLNRILCHLAGEDFRAVEAHFSFQSPLPQSRYREVFHCPVKFSRAVDGLLLKTRDLYIPIDTDRADLHQLLDQFTEEVLTDHSFNLGYQVEQLIENLLPTHNCSLSTIAQQLGFSPRTLQRQLASMGLSFEQMLDRARRSLADDYLAEYEMPLVQVSALLGYSEQSTFTRACRRWYGCTPLQRRKALLH